MKIRKIKKENKYIYDCIEFGKYDWFVIASKWAYDRSKTKMPFRRRQWARARVLENNIKQRERKNELRNKLNKLL